MRLLMQTVIYGKCQDTVKHGIQNIMEPEGQVGGMIAGLILGEGK